MKKIIFLLIFVLSCATERPGGKTEAEVLYKEAEKYMKDGHYLAATERLFSPLAWRVRRSDLGP